MLRCDHKGEVSVEQKTDGKIDIGMTNKQRAEFKS